jgi:hypothetical protein
MNRGHWMAVLGTLALALILVASPTQAGVVGYWTFDASNIADSSGNGYDGTNVGGTFSGDVPAALGGGQSIDFSGGNNYAVIDSAGAEAPFDLGNAMTVSAFVKRLPNGGWEPYVSKNGENNGWQMRRHGGNQTLDWTTRGAGPNNGDFEGTSTAVGDGNWHHVAMTYDGLAKRIYVDGAFDSGEFAPGSISNSGEQVVLGARQRSGPTYQAFSEAQLDDVSIHDQPLTLNQVQHLNSGGDPLSLPAPTTLLDAVEVQGPVPVYLVAGKHGAGDTWNVYLKANTSHTWDEHRVLAQGLTVNGVPGHLASIKDAAENTTAYGVTGKATSFIGLTDSTGTSTIDGTNFATSLGTSEAGSNPTNGWAWVDGTPLTYTNWHGGEPNNSGDEDIAQLRGDNAAWNDHNAGPTVVGGGNQGDNIPQHAAIYEFDTQLTTTFPFQAQNAEIDPLTGHYYERSTFLTTWDNARVLAEQTGLGDEVAGHLATISDARENELVRIIGGTGNKWIGLTDADATSTFDGSTFSTEGNFVWVTGEPVGYTNWNGGEPNNSGNEDAAHTTGGGGWNDASAGATIGDSDHFLTYVVEYEPMFSPEKTLRYRERMADTSVFGQVNDLAEAAALMGLPSGSPDILAEASANLFALSFHDPQASGGQGSILRQPFLTNTSGNDDDFAAELAGYINVPQSGDWTFAVTHDDWVRMVIDGASQEQLSTGNPTLFTYNLGAGSHLLEMLFFERAVGAYFQLFAAQGNLTSFDLDTFALVGDVYNGGLAIVEPEPGTLTLGLIGAGIAALRRRRRRKAA